MDRDYGLLLLVQLLTGNHWWSTQCYSLSIPNRTNVFEI